MKKQRRMVSKGTHIEAVSISCIFKANESENKSIENKNERLSTVTLGF